MPALKTPPIDSTSADLPTFLRMGAVIRMTGLGRSTIYRLVAQAKFPAPVRLASRAVAWRRVDLVQWSDGRPTVLH
jgi:prophage regulatory protein